MMCPTIMRIMCTGEQKLYLNIIKIIILVAVLVDLCSYNLDILVAA